MVVTGLITLAVGIDLVRQSKNQKCSEIIGSSKFIYGFLTMMTLQVFLKAQISF